MQTQFVDCCRWQLDDVSPILKLPFGLIHLFLGFCQNMILSWSFTSSLKWSSAEGPVPAMPINTLPLYSNIVDCLLPPPFGGSIGGRP